MFRFIKKLFVVAMTFFSCNGLECVSRINQERQVRLEILNINSNESSFYPYTIKRSKYSGDSKNINDSYAKLCVSDVVKNINVRVSNLMSRTNETRHIKWHETCKCKCRLDASIYNINNVGTMVNADVNVKN